MIHCIEIYTKEKFINKKYDATIDKMSFSMHDEDDLDSSDERPPPKSGFLDEFLTSMNADTIDIKKVGDVYPIRTTKHFLSLVKEKNDPIWKQCIPFIEELKDGNITDPLM